MWIERIEWIDLSFLIASHFTRVQILLSKWLDAFPTLKSLTLLSQKPTWSMPGGSAKPDLSASSRKIFSRVAAAPVARGKNELAISLTSFTVWSYYWGTTRAKKTYQTGSYRTRVIACQKRRALRIGLESIVRRHLALKETHWVDYRFKSEQTNDNANNKFPHVFNAKRMLLSPRRTIGRCQRGEQSAHSTLILINIILKLVSIKPFAWNAARQSLH